MDVADPTTLSTVAKVVGHIKAIIDESVAVVVDIVALLDTIISGDAALILAVLIDDIIAVVVDVVTGLDATIGREAASAVLVDDAVAVVINQITDLKAILSGLTLIAIDKEEGI